jgi:uncharacterized protein (DUF362 family)
MDPVALLNFMGDLRETLEEGMVLIDGFNALKSPLIIKPNICTRFDRTGFANTNVEVVDVLIDLALERDPHLSIKIVESDSGSKLAEDAFRAFGYTHLAEEKTRLGFDVSVVNLSRSPTTQIHLDGLYFRSLDLPNEIATPYFFVSLAVAKTHGLAFITGTMKNLFGLLPRKDQHVYHPHINDVIVDLNRVVRPDLCIVDARVGLEGWDGPKTRRLNAFIIGLNPVSVDSTMARIMGFDPLKIQQLRRAEPFNLGTLNPKVVGASIEATTVPFTPPIA